MSEKSPRISGDHAEPEEEEDLWPGRAPPSFTELLSRETFSYHNPFPYPLQEIAQADHQTRASRDARSRSRREPSVESIPTPEETSAPSVTTTGKSRHSDNQILVTKDTRDRSEREPSVERCVGCNEAWIRPIPEMDEELAPAGNNADYMRLTSNFIGRLRDERRRMDAAYADWKHRHSYCERPASPQSPANLDDSYAPRPTSSKRSHEPSSDSSIEQFVRISKKQKVAKKINAEESEEPLPEPDKMPVVEDDGNKPPYSYEMLIGMAILRAPKRRLTLAQILAWIQDTFAFYRNTAQGGWQNSIRHNLSLRSSFSRQGRPKDDPGKGVYWVISQGFEKQYHFVPAPPSDLLRRSISTSTSFAPLSLSKGSDSNTNQRDSGQAFKISVPDPSVQQKQRRLAFQESESSYPGLPYLTASSKLVGNSTKRLDSTTGNERANIVGPSTLPEHFFTQQNSFGIRQQRYNVRFTANYTSENMPSSQTPRNGSPTPPAALPFFTESKQPRSSPAPVPALEETPTATPIQLPAVASHLAIEPTTGGEANRAYSDCTDRDTNVSFISETNNDLTIMEKSGAWNQDPSIAAGRRNKKRQRSASPQRSQDVGAVPYKRLAVPSLDIQDSPTHDDDPVFEDAAPDTGRHAGEEDLQGLEGRPECSCESLQIKHMLQLHRQALTTDPNFVQNLLPENLKWDMRYQPGTVGGEETGVWTCTPFDYEEVVSYPLTIAGAPVILPVETRWPPTGGVNPPPDPRPLSLIDCRTTPSTDIVKDIFLTFEGCIGFYLLINGTLQLIVSEDFDVTMASSHLPHKYGGLKVSYIKHDMQPTMLPNNKSQAGKTATDATSSSSTPKSAFKDFLRPFRPTLATTTTSSTMTLQINDFIEARGKSSNKQKYSGRIGLQVIKDGCPFLIMSSHVITEAMLSRSFLGAGRVHTERLKQDWNDHVEIWAANERIGHVEKSYDVEVGLYPDGFKYDCTLINPQNASFVQDVKSPIADMGWLSRDSWASLRQQTSTVKILGRTEFHRNAKSVKCHLCSDVLIVGEGIFLNQTMAAGKPLKEHSRSTWESLVSRAVLYRVSPDFDPPTGYSGIALYAEGTREDGTQGPGIVGFQSFVQTSESVQNYEMEGRPLEQRLRRGRVAFYGAFQVPDELRQNYSIV